MSTVYMTIENVTDDGETNETYSIIDNMQIYRVVVEDGIIFTAYNQDMSLVEDSELSDTLIDQVEEFRKGE